MFWTSWRRVLRTSLVQVIAHWVATQSAWAALKACLVTRSDGLESIRKPLMRTGIGLSGKTPTGIFCMNWAELIFRVRHIKRIIARLPELCIVFQSAYLECNSKRCSIHLFVWQSCLPRVVGQWDRTSHDITPDQEPATYMPMQQNPKLVPHL